MCYKIKNNGRAGIDDNGRNRRGGEAIGGYKTRGLLGEGAFATVFLAEQEITGRQVALKVLKPGGLGNMQRRIQRFERETRLCADLCHPNIVHLLDKGRTADGRLFAVFEYVPGETLKDLLLRKGALPAVTAGKLMIQVLDALVAAHKAGVVHRDLKPGNIMITTTGAEHRVKVLDFGIGALTPNVNQRDYKRLTITHETLGTPAYSAPEQLRGETPTIKSDIYAWGLLMIECLTGSRAMHGVSLAEVFHNQLSATDVPLPPAIAEHPLGLLLRRVLQKKPELRIGDAEQLHEKFRSIDLTDLVTPVAMNGANFDTRQNDTATLTLTLPGARGGERRQITVLACNLGMVVDEEARYDLKELDMMHMEQLGRFLDIGTRHGGYHAGTLGDSVLLYFGYPYASDSDVARAARAASDLISAATEQNRVLGDLSGIRFEVRMGLHTGVIVNRYGEAPSGVTPNTALQLMRRARPGTVLASTTSCRLLGQAAGAYPLLEST